MSTELIYSDATKLAELIRTREVSPVEVMKAHLDRIEAVNPKVNAIVTIVEDALESAKKAEAAVQRGDELGPLHGVPFTAKDSIDTAMVPTQRGTPIFKGRTPDTDATSVARLKRAGGILLAIGLGSRVIAFLLAADMTVAYYLGDHDALLSFFSDPDKFYAAAPFTFLMASLIVLIFGPGKLALDSLVARLAGHRAQPSQTAVTV